MTPRHRLPRGAYVLLLACALAGAAALGLARREQMGGGIPLTMVTGRAGAAVGDSGVFASPALTEGVHPAIPHADAQVAAEAMAYWDVPGYQDLTVPYYQERPLERRHYCGRTYYVRPVVVMPDTTLVRSNTANDWMLWAPTWVVPICDDAGRVRTSVHFADVPQGLRVVQGDRQDDVPELVPDSGTFPYIGFLSERMLPGWERGIGTTPETAVAVAVARLRGTGARVTEVPEAFTNVMLLDPAPPVADSSRITAHIAICPRWRLRLDRSVVLRGAASNQVVRTRTVYVTRGKGGCTGSPMLQIPTPQQPTMVPFMYLAQLRLPRSIAMPPTGDGPAGLPDLKPQWTTLRVSEPIWFEEARPE